MKREYAATYHFGEMTVNIIAPPTMTDERKQQILKEWCNAFWAIWDSLSIEEKLNFNAEAEWEKAAEQANNGG